MDTARYRAFLAAAEAGSFSRAAERLNYTPSGVSQLVTALERELGFPLLRRNKKGVELTEDGARLRPIAGELLRQEARIFETAAEIRGLLVGSITIAAYPSIAQHWLPAVIKTFQEDHPNIKVQMMEGIWQEVDRWLEERTADVGFLSYHASMSYDWVPLAEDELLALLPRNHPLAGAKAYPLKRCAEDPFIMPALGRDADLLRLFRERNITPNIRFTTLEDDSAMAMVEQGLGVTVLNDLITRNYACDVVKLPLDPPAQITLGFALPSLTGASPGVRAFLRCAARQLTRRETETGGADHGG